MEMNFNFLESEDFGLAKSFSTAPVLAISPFTDLAQKETGDIEHELSEELANTGEYRSEGFCFKFAPGQDVSQVQRERERCERS